MTGIVAAPDQNVTRASHDLAIRALRRYRLGKAKLTLLGNAHNTTYCVDTSRGKFVLKLHPLSNVRPPEVESEMLWLEALVRETDILVPKPVRDADRQLIGTVEEGAFPLLCRVMTWVPGQRRAKGMRAKHFEALGELLGSLQNHSISFKFPAGFTRPQFGAQRLSTRLAALQSAAKDKLLTPAQLSFFERATEHALQSMRSLGHGRDVFGLIHGDLGYGNYLFHRGQAGAIDFEACGFGYFLEDLVEPIHFAQHVPHFPRLCADVLRGYRRQRPLDAKMESHLPAFLCCAAVTTAGYIASEPSRRNDLPEFAQYFSKNLPHHVPFLTSRRS